MASRKRLPLIIKNREEMIPLSKIGKALPRGPYDYRTIKLWCTVGRRRDRSDPASVVFLERVRSHGGGWCSSVEAYWRFLEALNSIT